MKKYRAWLAAFAVAFVVVDVVLRVTGVGSKSSKEEKPSGSSKKADPSNQDVADEVGQPGPQGGLSQPEKTDNAIPVNQDSGLNEGFTNEATTGNTD